MNLLIAFAAILLTVAADYSIPRNFLFPFKFPVVQFVVQGPELLNFEFLDVPFLGERPTITLTRYREFKLKESFFSQDLVSIDQSSLQKYARFNKVFVLNENICEHLELLGGFKENTFILLSVPRQNKIKYLPYCLCTYVDGKDTTTEFYHGPLGEELFRPKSDCSLIDQDHVLTISLNKELNEHIEFLKNNLISLPNNNFFAKYNNNWLFGWKDDIMIKRYTRAMSSDINFSDCQNIAFFLQDGGELIEFGSYIGDHYIYIKPYIHPDTIIHAFEPSHYFDIVLLLKFMYRLDNVIPFKQALHVRSNETVEFLNHFDQGSTMFSSKTGWKNSHVTRVETVSIDDYWEKANVNNTINIIRVDIEGGEWGSLLGANKFFSTAKLPIMYVEFHFNNFQYFEKDFHNFLKYAKHNLEIYYTDNCSKKFNIHAMGISANNIPDPQYFETIVVAKYFVQEFEKEVCPKLKKFKLSIDPLPSEGFRGINRLSNGFYSIGNRLNNRNLHDNIPSNKRVIIFINIDDHFVITESLNSKRCFKAFIYNSDSELLDYARYTLNINGLEKKITLSYFSNLADVISAASKIARSEGAALIGKTNSKECSQILQLENYVTIIPYSACANENEYHDLQNYLTIIFESTIKFYLNSNILNKNFKFF